MGSRPEARTEKRAFPGDPWDDVTTGDIHRLEANVNAGTVCIKVAPVIGAYYGASNVDEMNLHKTGVSSTVEEFKISGTLGDEDETWVDVVGGPFEVSRVVSDMHVGTVANNVTLTIDDLDATLSLTDDTNPHLGNILVRTLAYPAAIDIAGTMQGSIAIRGGFS